LKQGFHTAAISAPSFFVAAAAFASREQTVRVSFTHRKEEEASDGTTVH